LFSPNPISQFVNAVDLHFGYVDPRSHDYTNILRMFANSIDLCFAFATDRYDVIIVVYTDFAILSTYLVLALFHFSTKLVFVYLNYCD